MQDRDDFITENLKEHCAECRSLGYEVVGVFLQGSQNYGMDVMSTKYQSDVDTKAIVLPKFSDFCKGNVRISTTHIRENNSHIDIKDINTMFETFKKQNINFIEILFTDYYCFNPKYWGFVDSLRDIATEIAYANINQSLRCIAGTSKEKLKALCHPYPATKDKIEKYGYDPKQLHHIVRLNRFIKDFVSGVPYKDCLKPDQEFRNYCVDIKVHPMDLEKAKEMAERLDRETYEIKEMYAVGKDTINYQAYEKLDNLKVEILKKFFKEEILDRKICGIS